MLQPVKHCSVLLLALMALLPPTAQATTMREPILVKKVRLRVTGTAVPRVHSTLLQKARPVAHFQEDECYYNHQWLSSHSLFLVHAVYDAPTVKAEIINTVTGMHRMPQGINKFLAQKKEWTFRSCEVSPDGKWLLEHDRGGTNVMRIDGSYRRFVDTGGRFFSVRWLEDSTHWLCFFEGSNGNFLDYQMVWRYSRQPGEPKRTLPDTRRDDIPAERLITPSYKASGALLCYAAPVQEFSRESWDSRHQTHLVIRRRKLTSARRPTLVSRFALPRMGEVVDADFSPSRRRLAWLLQTSGGVTLYTSDIDGGHRRTIGFLAYQSDDGDAGEESGPADLRWLPGGRRLSFVYQNTVYTVPAP